MKSKYILIPLLLISFGFYQVENIKMDKSKIGFTPLMHKTYESRVNAYINLRKQKCLEKILLDAETYVDSVIINEINIKLLDTIIFPEKPLKPDFPHKIILQDTSIVKD
jgi:hypothetical protein